MSDWISSKSAEKPSEGDHVEVVLHGLPDESFSGTVLDRPRKLWVKLDDPPFQSVAIADENSIEKWRHLS